MQVIGLTGGVGSGKTLAARILSRHYNADLLIADELGAVAMEPGTDSFRRIVDHFGREVLREDGTLDREWLARRIFSREQERSVLNSIIHPVVVQYMEEYIRRRKEQAGTIVLESAILFEAGCDRLCDSVWYVYVSERIRRERLEADRGYSKEKIQAIMDRQLPEEEFFRRSDVVIENNGTQEELEEAICQAIASLQSEKKTEQGGV